MASQSKTQLQSRLRTRLRDISSTPTLSDSEIGEAMTNAINDPWVFVYDRDSSLSSVSAQASYTIPDGFSGIDRVGIDLNGDGYETVLDQSAWTEINGNLIFDLSHKAVPDGKTLFVWGNHKLSTSDLIPDNLQDYVLHVAMVECLATLIRGLSTRFLKNAMTMGDLVTAVNYHRGRIAELRDQMANRHAVVE